MMQDKQKQWKVIFLWFYYFISADRNATHHDMKDSLTPAGFEINSSK